MVTQLEKHPIREASNRTATTDPNTLTVIENHKTSAQKKLLISTILTLIGTVVTEAFFLTASFDNSGLHFVLVILFLAPFVLSLLGFLNKKKAKKVLCIAAAILCIIPALFSVTIVFANDVDLLEMGCMGPGLLMPAILFLVSALLNIIGTKEFFKNAE